MSKLQTEIAWWFPGGYSVVYKGSPKTRKEWMRLTWRGYLGFWQLAIRVAYIFICDRLSRHPTSTGEK